MKRVTTYGKVTGVWDPATSQATIAFPIKTVEKASWMKNLKGHYFIMMDP